MNNKNELNLGFIFKLFPGVQYHTLSRLIGLFSFNEAIRPKVEKNEDVNAKHVYEIVKSLYFPLLQQEIRSAEALTLYKATKNISKFLHGDHSAWKIEYEKWKLEN